MPDDRGAVLGMPKSCQALQGAGKRGASSPPAPPQMHSHALLSRKMRRLFGIDYGQVCEDLLVIDKRLILHCLFSPDPHV